ncbi:hypothetical protein BD309DRAFT_995672 [Dichomitus squalens]|uniref:Uncharacterized protein n=1 Tax=Dichomitus squalens TaxID=114155 RepID=A0A4Q9N6H9_9APHY|nr:hypothetical protein BD309DRAFT_995672 [Dichomitus squalens]TBU51141.1 hypothetical protein BD310DRAFT_953411 [Dichomitus squalens]
MAASELAAWANLFSEKWGARLIREWTQAWVRTRTLPESERGRHIKVVSLLSDSTVPMAVHTYLRSKKWSQNPVKLQKMLNNKLSSVKVHEYHHVLESEEMPNGLKKFIASKILPRYHLKPGRMGLFRSSMHRLLIKAHDGKQYSWLLHGESFLKKKGPGQGLHQSNFICSMNCDGFWNGEMFCKQLIEKFFPAFEVAHGPGHIAVIFVDNSQGHSCYAPDALHASKMNLNPGDVQPHMRDGWYDWNGQRITQTMSKGIKAALIEHGLWQHCDYTFDTLWENMPKALRSVSVELIRKWEHRAWRFIDTYTKGPGACEAQKKVKEFSSCMYKSHRRVPEQLAQAMDIV